MGRFGGMIFGVIRVMVVAALPGLAALLKNSRWKESTFIPSFQLLAVWLRDHFSSGMANYISYR